jgi:hypothetical protein
MNDRARLPLILFAAVTALTMLVPLTANLRGLFDGVLTPAMVDTDFVNYWMGATLALRGEHADLFTQQGYMLRLEEVFGPHPQDRAWSYPPHILLPLLPFGFLPYETALVLFLLSTFALFVAGAEALRRSAAPDADRIVVFAAIVAYAGVNAVSGQNGYLTGALLLFGLAFRGRRPVLAGLAFALLTIKPQLGILVPVLLLIERDWRTILWSGLFTAAFITLSVALLGTGVWHTYLTVTAAEQRDVLTSWTGPFLYMMPTAFTAVRSLGFDPSLAAVVQWPVSIAAALLATWLFVRDRSRLGRSFALLCATFLVSPYGFDYDMGALAVAAALMIASGKGIGRLSSVALIPVALLPATVMPLGLMGAPVAPVVLAVALLARARDVLRGRSGADTETEAAAPPAALRQE